MQKLGLTPYAGARAYERAYRANFEAVSGLGQLPFFPALLSLLAEASGVDRGLVELELKRDLMVCRQYFPASLLSRTSRAEIWGGLLLSSARGALKTIPSGPVLVDEWYPGAADDFYGRELLERLAAPASDFSGFCRFSPAALAGASRHLRGALLLKDEILAAHGVDLGRFIYRFFRDSLTGAALRGRIKAVVSGNDNSFPVIKAAAAGARTALIQNGNRPLHSDTAFKACDLYLAMGGEPFRAVMLEAGCRHGRYLPLGSLRLHNAVKKGLSPQPPCDVAYISPGLLYLYDEKGFVSDFFSLDAELATLKLINGLPDAGFTVTYHPAYDGELAALERRGLRSPAVRYADRSACSVYETLASARLALGTVSTAMAEALMLGKPVALVNLHGNPCLNTAYAALEAEYTGAGDFPGFIRQALSAPVPPGYAWQRGDYAAAAAAAVKELAA